VRRLSIYYTGASLGLAEHAFSIDQLDEPIAFEAHLHALAERDPTAVRDTAIVVGGGFTGIEIATELPAGMHSIFGSGADIRVIVIEQGNVIGPELGAGPRPAILGALASQKVACSLGTSMTEIDAGGVRTTKGERIESLSVLWTGGMRASPLTQLIACERDVLGRFRVNRDLRVPTIPEIFAAGDTACAATDDAGITPSCLVSARSCWGVTRAITPPLTSSASPHRLIRSNVT
jgi:NADH:ubiquinone reductase (H+-translocating)